MSRRVLVLQGHPDPQPGHFCHALADAYDAGSREAGHVVERIVVATLDFPLLRTKADWDTAAPSPAIRACQEQIDRAEQLVIVYPLWLGGMPALLKGFFEQVARPGFAIGAPDRGGLPRPLLTGKQARIVVTMGMPALIYRWYFGAHSLKSLERNILRFAGIRPIRESLIGTIEGLSAADRQRWLDRLRELGRRAA